MNSDARKRTNPIIVLPADLAVEELAAFQREWEEQWRGVPEEEPQVIADRIIAEIRQDSNLAALRDAPTVSQAFRKLSLAVRAYLGPVKAVQQEVEAEADGD